MLYNFSCVFFFEWKKTRWKWNWEETQNNSMKCRFHAHLIAFASAFGFLFSLGTFNFCQQTRSNANKLKWISMSASQDLSVHSGTIYHLCWINKGIKPIGGFVHFAANSVSDVRASTHTNNVHFISNHIINNDESLICVHRFNNMTVFQLKYNLLMW